MGSMNRGEQLVGLSNDIQQVVSTRNAKITAGIPEGIVNEATGKILKDHPKYQPLLASRRAVVTSTNAEQTLPLQQYLEFMADKEIRGKEHRNVDIVLPITSSVWNSQSTQNAST